MRLAGKGRFLPRRLSDSSLVFFAVLPVIISGLIHLGFLIYASRTQWHPGYAGKERIPKSILINIKKEQAPVSLRNEPRQEKRDSSKPREKKAYPRPKVEYRPSVTKIDPHPDILTRAGRPGMEGNWFKVDNSGGGYRRRQRRKRGS